METNLSEAFFTLFSANKRIHWIYILSSLFIAFIWLFIHKKEKKINLSSKLWLHKSAILDYKYFVVSFFIKTLLILPIIVSAKEISLMTYKFLLQQYGFLKITYFSYTEVMIFFTITLFVVSDFTRYWLHRFLHTVPFLWEFHKVHHSAKVLNPLTFYRIHPIENILFALRYSLSIGLVSGLFIYFFGAMIGVIEIVGVNIILFFFSLMGSNLRHSHIKLSYPKIIENILISPYAHQLHHSTKYYNKNYGGYLAIWDNFFGTLQLSHKIKNNEKIHFGVETKDFTSISNLLFTPFKKLGIKYGKKN